MKNSHKTNWERLQTMDDQEIDYSDIPATDTDFWEDAEVFYHKKKVTVHLKIDEDLALWLKEMGNHCDIAVNNLLRSYFVGMKNLSERQPRNP